jgi:hypothetical protein
MAQPNVMAGPLVMARATTPVMAGLDPAISIGLRSDAS